MAAASVSRVAISPNGDYLAHITPDGRLKLWETSSGKLKQEYAPSAHLSTACVCVSWPTTRHPFLSPRKKKKKRKADVEELVANLHLLAMGSSSGDILLYSVANGDIHAQMTNGHSSIVNDVCWQTELDRLFSCSDDRHVIQWSISSCKVKHKWKADNSSVYSICALDENNLLSASSCVKWWDLNTRQVIKTFTGHATEVFRILPVLNPEDDSVEGSYFLSAAVSDRLVNAWQLKRDKDKNSVASFSLSDDPANLSVSSQLHPDQPIILTVVTRNGVLHVFEHQLNGKCRKPSESKVTLQIASESSKDGKDKPRPIPVLAACVTTDREQSVLIIHGNFVKPTFERLLLKNCKKNTWLVRQDPQHASVTMESNVTIVKQPEIPDSVKVLAPGYMTVAGHVEGDERSSVKRKHSLPNSQLPMEDRLHALKLELPEDKRSKDVPQTNNLVHLLLQGLQSSDPQFLNSVLQRNDETLIRNTVRRLPLTSIIPLLQELHRRLYNRSQGNLAYLRWIKAVVMCHTSYLTTCQDVDTLLGPVLQFLEARTLAFEKMSLLKGRLDLLLSQVASHREEDDLPTEALLVHEDESSDDDLADLGSGPESEVSLEVASDTDVRHASGSDIEED